MVVKQESSVKCVCGQAIEFPEGEVQTKCACGAIWQCGEEGYWRTNAIMAKPIISSVKPHKEKYRNYPKSKRKGRKAGLK